jgi:putative ABC transport system permease protein
MTLATDFRSASRNVRRGGWLSATVVSILAVAIGAVTAIFSIAHAVLIRPLPVVEPDRVMLLWGRDDARSQQVVEVSLLDQRAGRPEELHRDQAVRIADVAQRVNSKNARNRAV